MAGPSGPVRRKIGRALRNSGALREIRASVDKRFERLEARQRATQRQVTVQQAHIDRAGNADKQVRQLHIVIGRQAKQLDKLTSTIAALQARVRPIEQAGSLREIDHARLTTQVGALEERAGRLEQRIGDGALITDDTSSAQARDLLTEVRSEHEQIRVRMQIISWYEERLRRVEASVTSMYDGDLRHPL
jgi:chromosome segregation ATPase